MTKMQDMHKNSVKRVAKFIDVTRFAEASST